MDLRTKIDLYVSVIGKNFDEESRTLLRNSYNVIAKQARKDEKNKWRDFSAEALPLVVKEERKRILDKLPEERPTDWDADRLTENIQTVCNDGFNECLSQVRNIISKPNI